MLAISVFEAMKDAVANARGGWRGCAADGAGDGGERAAGFGRLKRPA